MTTSTSVLDKAAERRAKYIRGLRELIALFESNPDLPTPYLLPDALVHATCATDEESIAAVVQMADRLGVEVKQSGGGSHFSAVVTLPSGAQYEFMHITRERMDHHHLWSNAATREWEDRASLATALLTPDDPALPEEPADHFAEPPTHHAAAFRHVEWWGWSCACGTGVPDGLTELAAKAAAVDHVESMARISTAPPPVEWRQFDEPQPSSAEAGIADEATGVEL